MRTNISQSFLKKITPKPNPFYIRSNTLKGFAVKINPSGSIRFIVEVRFRGTLYRKVLGSFPALSVADAEREALKYMNLVQTGQLQKVQQQQVTLLSLFEMYTSKVTLKPNSQKSYCEVFKFYLSDWQKKPVSSITKKMVEVRFCKIRDKGIFGGKPTYAQATKVMRVLSALMNYAIANELIETNPVDVLKHKRIDRSIRKREIYLKTEKVKELLDLTKEDKHPMVLAVRLMLYTGLRKNEALRLAWSDIQEISSVLCLVIRDTKNKRPHYIPVTKAIQQILKDANNDTPYVFPSPVSPDTHLKHERDTLKRLSKAIHFEFRCHDLRRTFATRAAEVELDFLIIKKLLNHKSHDITDQYIQRDSKKNLSTLKKALEHIKY